jgi:hypothetical protein
VTQLGIGDLTGGLTQLQIQQILANLGLGDTPPAWSAASRRGVPITFEDRRAPIGRPAGDEFGASHRS